METKGHRFTINKGEKIEEGKSHWPDFLRLYLPREEALTFAMNIFRHLEYPRQGANPLLEIPLFGTYERNREHDSATSDDESTAWEKRVSTENHN